MNTGGNDAITPFVFAQKWHDAAASLTEKQGYQEHFRDLCALLGHATPSSDPTGREYAFEKAVRKAGGEQGFADVWRRGHFAFEYKRRGRSLSDAYQQLVLYQHDLENPPLLVVTDFVRFHVHTNFTGTPPLALSFTLDDLRGERVIWDGLTALEVLRAVFHRPERLNPRVRRERITRDVTVRVGEVARTLRARERDQRRVGHFLVRLVFALFAEDAGLLPNQLVQRVLRRAAEHPEKSQSYLAELFTVMSVGGEMWGEDVRHFNGGLFDGEDALALTREELLALVGAADLDWADVEPSIFGTLFEQSLAARERRALGAHYTNVDDILRIVVEPLRQQWSATKESVAAALKKPSGRGRALELMLTFHHDLAAVKVLDAACGSGNFLYVTLKRLLDLEHEVRLFADEVRLGSLHITNKVHPAQMLGLEVEPFAAELASVVLWIGYIQWHRAHGGRWEDPVLQRLENIQNRDALLNADGSEAVWPPAGYVVGNPPFLGDKKMRAQLSEAYVGTLRRVYGDRLPAQADLVCYWFEKARALIEAGAAKRAGLVSTNSIRGGKNRVVLERVKVSGDVFMAWGDQPWVQDGAAVRVSFVGFDDGAEPGKTLDGSSVASINADLTSALDLTGARRLRANQGMAFIGTQKNGAFEIGAELARAWRQSPNPDGFSNADVVRPWVNGLDITRRFSDTWIIDFGLMTEAAAARYLVPFEYVRQHVKPERDKNNRASYREKWWQHAEARPGMRAALQPLQRYLVTPRVAKHRLWVFVPAKTLPDTRTVVVAREDDMTFGVLQSGIHTTWSLATCSWHGAGNDPTYNALSCFETFPFPCATEAQGVEIQRWAQHVQDVREQLLRRDERTTLAGLYNALQELRASRDAAHPAFALLLAHERLDAAVAAAYGWEWPLPEDEVLKRLLALNHERGQEP